MTTRIITSGKRKRAVARAVTVEGIGKITLNKKPYETLQFFDRLKIEEPIRIAKNILGKINFDISVNARGGGEKGQIEASRIAISRAIVKFTGNKDVEKAFLDYDRNLLVADVRRKEAYKPGDSKARRKRQTSYR
ncbi:MAG: 30S ribosomal protein S9 [Candidatus Pacearchaeota archaeon]|nr:30S ribosomal protein S9 [Candidatus Pacearchaeota archaeon]